MLVTHVECAASFAFCYQCSVHDLAAAVFRPDEIAVLVIEKDRFRADLAAPGVFNRSEFFVVVVEIHGSLQRLFNYLSLRDFTHFRAYKIEIETLSHQVVIEFFSVIARRRFAF